MKKGFTLIELLVVVLIIGILSAVALPQYQRTVLRSRTAEAWTNLKAIDTALKAYCLANPTGGGNFSTLRDSLDIEVNDTDNFTYTGSYNCRDANKYIYANYQGGGNYTFKLGIHPTSGMRSCEGTNCKEIGFTKRSSDWTICLCGSGNGGCYYAD